MMLISVLLPTSHAFTVIFTPLPRDLSLLVTCLSAFRLAFGVKPLSGGSLIIGYDLSMVAVGVIGP